MDKLKMHSMDVINDNVRRLSELFPECVTEIINDDDKLEKVIDFSVLNQVLSGNTINYEVGGGDLRENAISSHGQINQRPEL